MLSQKKKLCMSIRRRIATLLVLAVAAAARLSGQSAQEHLALGDRDYADGQLSSSLTHYLAALVSEPRRYDALWKASRSEIDLAESLPKGAGADSALNAGREHAERAVAANSQDAQGHFSLARAVGRKALSVGTMDRIRYSKIVRAEALEALKYDSLHPGTLHVLGMWNAEVMRVNGLARVFAKSFLGADVFALANWGDAQRYLEKAAAVDPDRLVHRLDLAGVCADRGDKAKARELYEGVIRAKPREFNDPKFQRLAAERLKKL